MQTEMSSSPAGGLR